MKKLLLIAIGSLLAVVLFFFVNWIRNFFSMGLSPFVGYGVILLILLLSLPFVIRGIRRARQRRVDEMTSSGGNDEAGNRIFAPAMLFAVGLVSWLVASHVVGLMYAMPTFDFMIKDTYFVFAYSFLMRGIALVFGIFCVLYHGYPRMFGRTMNSAMAYLHFWLTFIAVYFIFWPVRYADLYGMPRRYVNYSFFGSWPHYETYHPFTLIMIGSLLIAQLLFVFNFIHSLIKGKKSAG